MVWAVGLDVAGEDVEWSGRPAQAWLKRRRGGWRAFVCGRVAFRCCLLIWSQTWIYSVLRNKYEGLGSQ